MLVYGLATKMSFGFLLGNKNRFFHGGGFDSWEEAFDTCDMQGGSLGLAFDPGWRLRFGFGRVCLSRLHLFWN